MRTAEDILKKKKSTELITVDADTVIHDAIKMMVRSKIGSILITENSEITGIWTERDLLKNSATDHFDPKSARIGDYMTTELHSAAHTDTVYQLKDRFLGLYIRRLLIQKYGEYIGLISVGDVIKTTLREKADELKSLKTIVSWEYYEDWKWNGVKR